MSGDASRSSYGKSESSRSSGDSPDFTRRSTQRGNRERSRDPEEYRSNAEDALRIIEQRRIISIHSLVDTIVGNFTIRGGSDIIAQSDIARQMTQNKMSQSEYRESIDHLRGKDLSRAQEDSIANILNRDYTDR